MATGENPPRCGLLGYASGLEDVNLSGNERGEVIRGVDLGGVVLLNPGSANLNAPVYQNPAEARLTSPNL
jgi:hypothetical protein